MDKIRILRIIARLNTGGPAMHTVLLTSELNDGEFESVLMTGSISGGEGDMGYFAERYNVKPVYVPCLERAINPARDLIAFIHILLFIRRYRPDIVHTHTAKAGTLGRLAAFIARVPVKVHTFHGHVFAGYFNSVANRFVVFTERVLAGATDAIIAISAGQKNEIVNEYRITDSSKCHVVKLGFDLDEFLVSERKRGEFRKRFDFKDDDILIGIVGRLTAIKNHKMFIDMAAYVCAKASAGMAARIKFIVVGDGELRQSLSAYSKEKGMGDNMRFVGWVRDIAETYSDIDIVTLTSLNEGTPVSLIEAMASGKPVISTDVGGVRDTVGAAGILVKEGDFVSMGNKALELCSSADARDVMGKRGRERVKDMYPKERLVSELKKLYNNLLLKNREGLS